MMLWWKTRVSTRASLQRQTVFCAGCVYNWSVPKAIWKGTATKISRIFMIDWPVTAKDTWTPCAMRGSFTVGLCTLRLGSSAVVICTVCLSGCLNVYLATRPPACFIQSEVFCHAQTLLESAVKLTVMSMRLCTMPYRTFYSQDILSLPEPR